MKIFGTGINRLLFVLTAVIMATVFVGALFAAGIVVDTVRGQSLLPYEFSQQVYDADKFEVCPGETVTWQEEMTVNLPFQAIVINSFVSQGADITEAIPHTGRQLFFKERAGLPEYYRQRGREIDLPDFPIVLSRTLTATVPSLVQDAPLFISFTIVYSDREGDTYSIPLWVKSDEECD